MSTHGVALLGAAGDGQHHEHYEGDDQDDDKRMFHARTSTFRHSQMDLTNGER